jgi:hypothetical protein
VTDPGWYYGFVCNECGASLPVERLDKAAADTGARPIAIGAHTTRRAGDNGSRAPQRRRHSHDEWRLGSTERNHATPP